MAQKGVDQTSPIKLDPKAVNREQRESILRHLVSRQEGEEFVMFLQVKVKRLVAQHFNVDGHVLGLEEAVDYLSERFFPTQMYVITVGNDCRECFKAARHYWHVLNLAFRIHEDDSRIDKVSIIVPPAARDGRSSLNIAMKVSS